MGISNDNIIYFTCFRINYLTDQGLPSMAKIMPFSEENRYLAQEFLMKDPYKNTIMSSFLEESGKNSMVIYDNGVIRGIMAVSPDYRNLWFYGNRAAFKTVIDNMGYSEFNLYIDQKNLDIALARFNFSITKVLVMRLKIRDYNGTSQPAVKLKNEEITLYGESFGYIPEFPDTFVQFRGGSIVAAGSVISTNSRSCAIGSIRYIEGSENSISNIISATVAEYKNQTENIVVYLDYDDKIKSILEKEGFIFTAELIKLHQKI